jgi:hypothetical protein
LPSRTALPQNPAGTLPDTALAGLFEPVLAWSSLGASAARPASIPALSICGTIVPSMAGPSADDASAAGVGLAWTFHWYYSLLFFLGPLSGWFFTRTAPKKAEEYTFPVASGIIAGGSLMGVILVFWENGPEMMKKLIGQLGQFIGR